MCERQSEGVIQDASFTGARHHVAEHRPHHIRAPGILLLNQILVRMEVFEALLPHDLGTAVVYVATNILNTGMRLMDVVLPGREGLSQIVGHVSNTERGCGPAHASYSLNCGSAGAKYSPC